MITTPEIKIFEERNYISKRKKTEIRGMSAMIKELFWTAGMNNLKPKGKVFTIYYDRLADPKAIDYEVCLPIEKADARIVKRIGGDRCVHIRVKGSYRQFHHAYTTINQYIKEEKLTKKGPPREVYTRGPILGLLAIAPLMVTDIYQPVG